MKPVGLFDQVFGEEDEFFCGIVALNIQTLVKRQAVIIETPEKVKAKVDY